jgi:spoIIIJ-associated protein
VEAVAAELDPDASVEVVETDEALTATLTGGDPSLFIGKQGSTIDAVQHLAARATFRGASERKAVVVDAGGYRARREAALIRTADRAVADALAYERPIELEPMGAAERRVVHTYLKDRTDVQTHSEGEEPERRLVVTPVSRGG